MDIQNDARRLTSVGTFFIILGWVAVIYAVIAGILWWIDLAQREAFNIFEAFAISRRRDRHADLRGVRPRGLRLLPAPVRALGREPVQVAEHRARGSA